MKLLQLFSTLLILIISLSFCNSPDPVDGFKLYYNGDIITMKGEAPEYIESVVTHSEKIVFTFSLLGFFDHSLRR